MFKLFIALNLFLFNLLACNCGYESCILKVNDSKSITNQRLQIPLPKNQKLVFSLSKPNATIIKHDPFLNLYLIKDTKPFKYPFIINQNTNTNIVSITKKMALEGKILKKQIGLNSFATFSEPPFTPALLLNSCCYLEGLVTSKGIIQKDYLRRFINSKNLDYGEIGIRVRDENTRVIVDRVNPFVKDNPFQQGDIILYRDGLKVKNSATFMKKILFAKMGSSHKIELLRGSKKMTYLVKTYKRYGGGYISDTFLEQIGIYLDKDLTILRVWGKYVSYGIKIGDKLIQVNSKKVSSYDDIAINIANFKEPVRLLLLRDGFQFFITID